jgi:hypothetical protein
VEILMRYVWTVVAVAIVSCASGMPARAADVAAGKAAAQAKCSQCHDADDWDGEDAASLESLIRDIVAGKVKHRGKLDLSSTEISDIAAYWGRGGKEK